MNTTADLEIQVARPLGSNYTPANLMQQYVREHYGHSSLTVSKYGDYRMYIKGTRYEFAGWSWHPDGDLEQVTLYLREG